MLSFLASQGRSAGHMKATGPIVVPSSPSPWVCALASKGRAANKDRRVERMLLLEQNYVQGGTNDLRRATRRVPRPAPVYEGCTCMAGGVGVFTVRCSREQTAIPHAGSDNERVQPERAVGRTAKWLDYCLCLAPQITPASCTRRPPRSKQTRAGQPSRTASQPNGQDERLAALHLRARVSIFKLSDGARG